MLKRLSLCSLIAAMFLLMVDRAFASTFVIPVVSGTFSYSWVATDGDALQPRFDLTTTLGTLTGTTTAFLYCKGALGPCINTVQFETGGGFIHQGITDITLTMPDTVHFWNNGNPLGDWLTGVIMPEFAVDPPSTATPHFYFSLDLHHAASGNEYRISGSGAASISYDGAGRTTGVTFAFVPSPEPSTGAISLIALLLAGVVLKRTHRLRL